MHFERAGFVFGRSGVRSVGACRRIEPHGSDRLDAMSKPAGGQSPDHVGSPPLRIASAFRTVLFWPSFLVFLAWMSIYRTLAIDIPCAVSARYRAHNYHRLWNRIIAGWGLGLLQIAKTTVGLKVRIEGAVPRGRHIVVANHQSSAEIVVLIGTLRSMNVKFIVLDDLSRFKPNVSTAVRRGGFCVVDQSGSRDDLRRLLGFARALAEWEGSPLIYPEGKRTPDGSIGPFQAAGLKILVRETGLPVLPVVIDGLWRARTISDFLFFLPGAECRLRILPPIPADEAAAHVSGLAARLECRMRDELAAMRHEPRTASAAADASPLTERDASLK